MFLYLAWTSMCSYQTFRRCNRVKVKWNVYTMMSFFYFKVLHVRGKTNPKLPCQCKHSAEWSPHRFTVQFNQQRCSSKHHWLCSFCAVVTARILILELLTKSHESPFIDSGWSLRAACRLKASAIFTDCELCLDIFSRLWCLLGCLLLFTARLSKPLELSAVGFRLLYRTACITPLDGSTPL